MGLKNYFSGIANSWAINKAKSKASIIAQALGHNLRPQTDWDGLSGRFTIQVPRLIYRQLKQISYNSDALSVAQISLRREIFRNGGELVEAKDLLDDDMTSSEETVSADINKKKEIIKWMENVNENGQNFIQVLKEGEDDLNIIDDAFFLNSMAYGFNTEGDIVSVDYKEFLRISPDVIHKLIDIYDRLGYTEQGEPVFTCPIHRAQEFNSPGFCSICAGEGNKIKLQRAYFKTVIGKESTTYYLKDEIIHVMKYRPNKRRGYSPVFTCWKKAKILDAQDSFMFDAYFGKRDPKGILAVNTTNAESLKKAWKDMVEFAMKYPNATPLLAVDPTTSGGGKPAEYLSLMRNLQEMEFTDTRDEMWKHIGAVYGVSPIFQNDVSTSGGLNNEGLQITVTNRAVETGQKIYNEDVIPIVFRLKGWDGWVYRLKPSEEQDEMAKLQRQEQSLRNGETALGLGLTCKFNSKIGEVVIESGEMSASPLNTGDQGFFGDESPSQDSSKVSGSPQNPDGQDSSPSKSKEPKTPKENKKPSA